VRRYAGRPFALLGVNVDATREEAQYIQQQAGLTWPNWWDGGGKISEAWKVDGLPSLFLIDGRGIVRWRHVGKVDPRQLEARIDEVLPR
jgi:cytochrome c biogenesis protein CcmG/thiol:disulfide interchange protein DsbE